MRAEVEALEESLVGSPQTAEGPGSDSESAIRQVRRAVIEQDLRAKMTELALLTERAGLPPGSPATREAGVVPIIGSSHQSTPEPVPASRKRGPRGRTLQRIESNRFASETAVPDAMLEERADGEAFSLEETASQLDLAASREEATGKVSSQTEAQVGSATSGFEPAAESRTIAVEQAEARYSGRQTWERTVAVVTGGLLALVVVGALFAWAGSVPIALGIPRPDSSSSADILTVVVRPIDEGELEPEDGSGAPQPGSATEAGMELLAGEGLEPELDSIAGRERELGPETTTESVGESIPVNLTATIDAPGFVGVNLRRAPSTSAAAIQVIPTGTRVELLDGQVEDEGLGWQRIRAPDGETGWVVSGTIHR